MFNLDLDTRLSEWARLRHHIEKSETPLEDICDFWAKAPFTPFNNHVDHYFQGNWPTPWEIISENRYDDFTKALMMAWTLKYTKRFQNSNVELRTYVDENKTLVYNVVVVDESKVLNFNDTEPVDFNEITNTFLLENLIEVKNRP